MARGKKLCVGAGSAKLRFPDNYFPHEGYIGVHDDVCARVLLLYGDEKVVLVSIELPSIRPFNLIDDLRKLVSDRTGAKWENVWIVVAHDLSAPHVPKDQEDIKFNKHMLAIESAIEEALSKAEGNMCRAKVSFGTGSSDVISNRDVESVDGWWVGINREGLSDKTLFVVRFTDMNDKPVAVLFNYALKSSVMEDVRLSDGFKRVTGDLCGEACRRVENETGAVCLFFMGAAGDQVPSQKAKYLAVDENGKFYEVDYKEKGYEFLETLGAQLASDVIDVIDHMPPGEETVVLKALDSSLQVPGQVRYPYGMPKPPIKYYDFPKAEDQELLIKTLRINDCAIVGVKPEIMTATNLELKAKSPFKYTLLFSMVNGGQDYIPTDIDYERFEYPALHATVAKGTDRLFVNETTRMLNFLTEEHTGGAKMKKIKIGCISGWQAHADKFGMLANSYDESEVVALWDENPERGAKNAAAIGCQTVPRMEDIINDPEIDAVIIMSSPTVHTGHILAAINAGKHVYVEKPLCITDEDATQIEKAVKASGLHFTLSDPIIKPTLMYVKKLMDDGVIGKITGARCRVTFGMMNDERLATSEGVERLTGFGGAIGDSHTTHVLFWLLGKPVAANAIMQKDPGGNADINTAAVYQFESGAIGVAEACVTSNGTPYALEVYGTNGSIYATREEVYYHIGRGDWVKVPAEDLPEPMEYILHYWVKSIYNDTPNDVYTVDDGVLMIKMQNAARRAAENVQIIEY